MSRTIVLTSDKLCPFCCQQKPPSATVDSKIKPRNTSFISASSGLKPEPSYQVLLTYLRPSATISDASPTPMACSLIIWMRYLFCWHTDLEGCDELPLYALSSGSCFSHVAGKTFRIKSFSKEDIANLQQETAVPGNGTTEISLSETIGNFWKNTEHFIVPSAEEQLKP